MSAEGQGQATVKESEELTYRRTLGPDGARATAAKPADTREGLAGPWDVIVKALGAIAAGVGILGFVTLAGGVILFENFLGAGIPAVQAVALVPRAELLTTGASDLLPLAGFVGLVLVVMWLLERQWKRWGIWPVAIAAGLGGAGYYALTADHSPRWYHVVYLLLALGGGVILAGLVWNKLKSLVESKEVTGLVRFGWFTILVVILIPVEGAMIGWVQSRETPLVRPAALYESASHTVVTGFFVASNGGHVYLAEVGRNRKEPDVGAHNSGRILSFPSAAVSRLAVGAGQSLRDARARLVSLAKDIEIALPPGAVGRVVP